MENEGNGDNGSLEAPSSCTSFTIQFQDVSAVVKPKKKIKIANMFGMRKHTRTFSLPANDPLQIKPVDDQETESEPLEQNKCSDERENDNEENTSSCSEAGTYTLEKDEEMLQQCRKDMDRSLGLENNHKNGKDESAFKTTLINRWVEDSKRSSLTNLRSDECGLSRIPSPVVGNRRKSMTSLISNRNGKKGKGGKVILVGEDDASRILNETRLIVNAMEKRVDEAEQHSKSRFGKAFGFAKEACKKPFSPEPNRRSLPRDMCWNQKSHANAPKTAPMARKHPPLPPPSSPSLPLHRPSVKFGKQVSSFPMPKVSSLGVMKQQSFKSSGATSAAKQAIELQNWKRRKSYNPMKAVEEAKKKSPPSGEREQHSVSAAALRPPVTNGTSMSRSVSFHGYLLRKGEVYKEDDTSSTEEEVSLPLDRNGNGERTPEWTVPDVPSNSPPGSVCSSHVSFLSDPNKSYSNSYRMVSSTENVCMVINTNVDVMKVTAVAQLSEQIKLSSYALMNKLKSKCDLKTEKSALLSEEIDRLIVQHDSDASSSDFNKSNQSTPHNCSIEQDRDQQLNHRLSDALNNLKLIRGAISTLYKVLSD